MKTPSPIPLVFEASTPRHLPEAVRRALNEVYEKEEPERNIGFSQIKPNDDDRSNFETFFLSPLVAIAQSEHIASAAINLEKSEKIPNHFWHELFVAAIDGREAFRTSDKRTTRKKIQKLEQIQKSLLKAATLVASEAVGNWKPGLDDVRLYQDDTPFDQLLLDGTFSKPTRLSLTFKNDGGVQRDGTAEVPALCISRLNEALAARITDMIKTPDLSDQFLKKGNAPVRFIDSRLMKIFDRTFPKARRKVFVDARHQMIAALLKAVLERAEPVEELAIAISASRRKR